MPWVTVYTHPPKSSTHSTVCSLFFSAGPILLFVVLPGLVGLASLAVICGVIYCIYRITCRETNAQGAPVVQPQQVALYPVYAGPMPDAPPGGMVPGQPIFSGNPYMQPAFTAPPVPKHKDKPSSSSSQQQEDAPPSYDVATGGEP